MTGMWFFRHVPEKFSGCPETCRFSCIDAEMMSGSRKLLIAAGMAMAALPALAAERGTAAPGQLFAACAGRFSAEMEHAWLTGGTGDAARDARETFVALTEAAIGPQEAAAALDTRIRAKRAQAALLLQGDFHTDRTLARRAKAMAQRQRRLCEAMILG